MRWVRILTVLPALLAIVASAQCVARCAAMPCQQQSEAHPAPCHRHSSPQQNTPAKPCAMPLILVDGRGIAVPAADRPNGPIATVAPPPLPVVSPSVGRLRPAHAPPVASLFLHSFVLRV
jgi:hypothetical protein